MIRLDAFALVTWNHTKVFLVQQFFLLSFSVLLCVTRQILRFWGLFPSLDREQPLSTRVILWSREKRITEQTAHLKWNKNTTLGCSSMPIGKELWTSFRIHKIPPLTLWFIWRFSLLFFIFLIVKGTTTSALSWFSGSSKWKEWSCERVKSKENSVLRWIYSFLIAFLIPTRQRSGFTLPPYTRWISIPILFGINAGWRSRMRILFFLYFLFNSNPKRNRRRELCARMLAVDVSLSRQLANTQWDNVA